MIKRRIGPNPHDFGGTPAAEGCPDIFELENGDFGIIGIDNTEALTSYLPGDASCGHDERIVVVPRRILVAAKNHIPEE